MAKIPRYEDTTPILNAPAIRSGAEGYDAFAKTLASISSVAAKEAVKIQSEKSNSMYLSSLSNMEQLKTSAQELMLQDPTNAAKHIETMQESVNTVLANSYVNDTDRQKLKYFASKLNDDMELEGVKTEVKQGQIAAEFEHYKNWPSQLNLLSQAALDPDHSKFESLSASMNENIKNLVLTHALTALQGKAQLETMSAAVDAAHDVYDLVNSARKQTAANYHTAMASPFDPDKTKNVNYPVDENTRWLTNYHLQDRTFEGVIDALYDHNMDQEAIAKLTSHQRQEVRSVYNGIRMADGLIDSNTSLPLIKSRLEDLENHGGHEAVAERKALKRYVNDIENGNSQELMARTALGGQIVQKFTATQAFLDNKLKMTDPSNTEEIKNINAAIAKNKNNYVNESVALADAKHWPVVSPIPKTDLALVENGFSSKGDAALNATQAYKTMSQYDKRNQIYFADQVSDPKKKVVLQTIALGNQTDGEKIDFIAANQDRKYQELDAKTNQAGDSYLRNQVNVVLGDAIKVISAQNHPANANILNEHLIGASVNYAKYLSEKAGRFALEKDGIISTYDSGSNIANVKRFIKAAYDPISGANYVINRKQIDLTDKQMQGVAAYAIQRGEEYLRAHMSEAQFIQLKGQAPLSATITPTNILIAKDGMGNIAFREPLTGDLVAHAEEEVAKTEKKKRKHNTRFFRSNQKKTLKEMAFSGKDENIGEEE